MHFDDDDELRTLMSACLARRDQLTECANDAHKYGAHTVADSLLVDANEAYLLGIRIARYLYPDAAF